MEHMERTDTVKIIEYVERRIAAISNLAEFHHVHLEVGTHTEMALSFLTAEVKKMALSANMFAPPQPDRTQEQKKFLHGSDCVDSSGKPLREVTLKVTNVRTAPPGFGSPLLLDFEKQFDCETLPLNKTNIRALGMLCADQFKSDDLELLRGHSLIFQIVKDRNPNSNVDVPTLRVASDGLLLAHTQQRSTSRTAANTKKKK
jgi:hypothetical protein